MPDRIEFGAYSDAVPPVYVVGKIQEPPNSAYEPHTEFRNLFGIKMRKSLAMKLLWQVKTFKCVLEYSTPDTPTGDWVAKGQADFIPRIETQGPAGIQSSGGGLFNYWSDRKLRIPQGNINGKIPSYSQYPDQNRTICREGFTVINPFIPGDNTTYESEKAAGKSALQAEKQAIEAKITQIKTYATAYKYFILKQEIERQENSFRSASTLIINEFEYELGNIVSEFESLPFPPPSWSTTVKTTYAQRIQRLRNKYLFKLRQQHQLEWFEWDGGFEKKINFNDVCKIRLLGPKALANPPSILGIFSGIAFQSKSTEDIGDQCLGIINPNTFSGGFNAFGQTNIFFEKDISYAFLEFKEVEDEEPREETEEDKFVVLCVSNIFECISTNEETARKLYIKPTLIYADLRSGLYITSNGTEYRESLGYKSFFDAITDAAMDGPPFQEDPSLSPEQKKVVYSGDFFGGTFGGAKAYFESVANKIRQLKNPSNTLECGYLRIKGKDGNILLETKLYTRREFPFRNVTVTYSIEEYHTDPVAD